MCSRNSKELCCRSGVERWDRKGRLLGNEVEEVAKDQIPYWRPC